MSAAFHDLTTGQHVVHPELGDGVVLAINSGNYVTVFFRLSGQRQVPLSSLQGSVSREVEIISHLKPTSAESLTRLWLAIEAEQLPLIASTVTLTAAKIDLLPHQVVLTHRIAQSSPRRFLIADEVGLGKTVETALVLRELASRGQLERALVVVPAGLVENWRREMNDTFHLDFEVFGSEGDVTDRKSNAFAKHNRLIASIDTLKRPARINRLLDSPRYDLIVFDEAHHLTATRFGRKVNKTENFKLAEALRDHTRDLLLLSATPHQGDHFRFWMLVRLLDPGLFVNEEDMLANRHRLNSAVIRRTKADACARDGSSLFARRQVHTNCFTLSDGERIFYESLRLYLTDGYNIAYSNGNAGRVLGFIMTIFQKLAASSFAAVRITLEKRLFRLTVFEIIVCEQALDIDGRDNAIYEAKSMLRQMYNLSESYFDEAQVDRLLADARLQILKRLKQEKKYKDVFENEEGTIGEEDEDVASVVVSLAIPEERRRIQELLAQLPEEEESKAREIVRGLRAIWDVNPREKVVIFTTYLGSVDMLQQAIIKAFSHIGVEILKGGDHGAKIASERRFRQPLGPQVLICTAAGREGINLQFAHVLFNADLPWNPMELEQRIGRIHRYGQQSTAQVYNIVALDTIEGKIFLLLEQKVNDIASALGKVDENGYIAEDLRSQILGQLSERLSYDKLYQEGLQDPTLLRTRLELEVAMKNVELAEYAVLELFQDLDGFRLDDYEEVDDDGQSVKRLQHFVTTAVQARHGALHSIDHDLLKIILPGENPVLLTTNRDIAVSGDEIDLIGLEQPLIAKLLTYWASLPIYERALVARVNTEEMISGIFSVWHIGIQGNRGSRYDQICWVGVTNDGERSHIIEKLAHSFFDMEPAQPILEPDARNVFLKDVIPNVLQRELIYNGALSVDASYVSRLLGWIEIVV